VPDTAHGVTPDFFVTARFILSPRLNPPVMFFLSDNKIFCLQVSLFFRRPPSTASLNFSQRPLPLVFLLVDFPFPLPFTRQTFPFFCTTVPALYAPRLRLYRSSVAISMQWRVNPPPSQPALEEDDPAYYNWFLEPLYSTFRSFLQMLAIELHGPPHLWTTHEGPTFLSDHRELSGQPRLSSFAGFPCRNLNAYSNPLTKDCQETNLQGSFASCLGAVLPLWSRFLSLQSLGFPSNENSQPS